MVRQGLDQNLVSFILRLSFWCFWTFRRARIDSTDERIGEFEILIPTEYEIDHHPQKNRITTDLTYYDIKRLDGHGLTHHIPVLVEDVVKAGIVNTILRLED